jgi:hypothetical protein
VVVAKAEILDFSNQELMEQVVVVALQAMILHL